MQRLDDDIKKAEAKAANRDPITGAPGAHPVGVGIGAAAGGAAGAAIGTVAGPVGTAVGAAAGAIAGGLAGKAAAESVDPTVETAYWRTYYTTRPYVDKGAPFTDYEPAYRYGWESYGTYRGRPMDEFEADLARDWERRKGNSRLNWDRAKLATRDAYDRACTTCKSCSK